MIRVKKYNKILTACYLGFITQAISANFAPLLFLSLWESEEVFKFIICTFSQVFGDYEAGDPECGFLFPAFMDRSAGIHGVLVYQADAGKPHRELVEQILFHG